MDDLAGKNAEKISSAGFRREVKFRGGSEFQWLYRAGIESRWPRQGRGGGEFRRSGFQGLHGAIGEDDAVPANIAAGVAFRDGVIRGWIPRQEPEAQLTIFVGGNGGWGDCAGGHIQRPRVPGRLFRGQRG